MRLVPPLPRLGLRPRDTVPSARVTDPPRRSWTYSRSLSSVTSFATFGRLAACWAFHWATLARYSSVPPRVAALRRNSREIVPGSHPRTRAISRRPAFLARRIAISSRSSNDRYRPVGSVNDITGMPQRDETTASPPAPTRPPLTTLPPSSRPSRSCARTGAARPEMAQVAPGIASPDATPDQHATAAAHLPEHHWSSYSSLPSPFLNTSMIKVLRRPVESADAAVVGVEDRTGEATSLVLRRLERFGDWSVML